MSRCESTPFFKNGGGVMARLLWGRYGRWPTMWLCLAAVALGVAGGIADLRLLVVALMILFLGLPMVLAFLYINHGLKKMTALNMLDHRVCVSGEKGVWAEVSVRNDDDEEPEIRRVPLEGHFRFDATSNGVTIEAGEGGVLYVPYSIWEDDKEAFGRWMEAVRAAAVLPCGEN